MKLDGVFGDTQTFRNLAIHKSLGKQLQNLNLAWREFRNEFQLA